MTFFKPTKNANHVFVYGANLAGIHGAGAAKEAMLHWGAEYGKIGHVGRSYGIPTKSRELKTLSLYSIGLLVAEFLEYARENPELTFLVTPIGTGLAGYSIEQIAPMFKNAPENCRLAWEI